LVILNRGSEPIFMNFRKQEVIDIIICSEKVAGTGLKSVQRSGSDHRRVRFSLKHMESVPSRMGTQFQNNKLEEL